MCHREYQYIYRKDGPQLEMMTPGNKTQIVAGMDRQRENNQKQDKSVSRFRQVLPQVSNYILPRLVGIVYYALSK
jgi:hypothetical protein